LDTLTQVKVFTCLLDFINDHAGVLAHPTRRLEAERKETWNYSEWEEGSLYFGRVV